MDLAKLSDIPPYGIVSTNMGDIAVFFLSANGSLGISKSTKNDNSTQNDIDFAKIFFPQIIWPTNSLRDGKYKPKIPFYTPEDISHFSEDELDQLAHLFLAHSEYLYKKSERVETKRDDGTTSVSYKPGETTRPKNEDESNLSYLNRVYTDYNKVQTEKLMKSFKSFLPYSSFSEAINRDMLKSFALGEQLKKSLQPITSALNIASLASNSWDVPPNKALFPELGVPSIVQDLHIQSPKPNPLSGLPKKFGDFNNKLDELIAINAATSTYAVESNQIQVRVLNELTQSSQISTDVSFKNLSINRSVLVITAASLIFSSIFTWLTWREAQSSSVKNDAVQMQLLQTLNKLNENISRQASPPSTPTNQNVSNQLNKRTNKKANH